MATLAIAMIFRKDVTQALGRVGQFKYRDLEVTFRADLHQAESIARSIPAMASKGSIVLEADTTEAEPLVGHLICDPSSSVPTSGSPAEGREALVKLADRSPRQAVEEAWAFVGKGLVKAARNLGDRRSSGLSNPDAAARFLIDRGWLAGPEALLVGLLRTLRDRASKLDQPAPSTDEARRFVDLALQVASRIEERA